MNILPVVGERRTLGRITYARHSEHEIEQD